MWDTHQERETDTLTWFLQQFKLPMPMAVDIIAAGIQDIAAALKNPGPNLPLNPLTNQQATALCDLVTIFTGVLPVDDTEETPSCLRVEPQKEREPEVPVMPPAAPTVPPALAVPPVPPTVIPTLPVMYTNVAHHKPRGKKPAAQQSAATMNTSLTVATQQPPSTAPPLRNKQPTTRRGQ
jgi:hypothetical protein